MAKTKLKQATRVQRIVELRSLGYTLRMIADKMKAEGYRISEHTVWRDLHSAAMDDINFELMRRQLADINASNDIGLRLEYRSRLIKKLMTKPPTFFRK